MRWLTFLLVSSYLALLKASSPNTFRTRRNISLYFKRRQLIIYNYCIAKFLEEEPEYCKRRAELSADISARLFRVMRDKCNVM